MERVPSSETKRVPVVALALIGIMLFLALGVVAPQEAEAATLYWPVPGHKDLSRGFSPGGHDGIDICDGSINGAEVKAAIAGTVVKKFTHSHNTYNGSLFGSACVKTGCCGYGTGVCIRGNDGKWYTYGHMQAGSIPGNVYEGAQVSMGQTLGRVGSTGNASGPHLHFAIHTVSWWENGVNPYSGNTFVDTTNHTVSTNGATNIGNESASISGSVSPSTNVSSWGFYIGTNASSMKKCTVKAGSTASSNMKANVQSYYALQCGTRYYYKVWAVVNGSEKVGSVQNFTTKADKPSIPTLKANDSKVDLGIGDAPTVTWAAASNAKSYTLYLYSESGEELQKNTGVTGTKHAFSAITEAGTYRAYIEAVNSAGSKGKSSAVSFTVHPDVTVTFKDAESFVDVEADYKAATLSTEVVHYGKAANVPASPSHKGYTFKEWSGNYKSVTADTMITAVYTINQYTVKFVDSQTGDTLGSQKVDYCGAATPMSYEVPSGYKKLGYDGWDKDYSRITEDTTLSTCVGWYNDNMPVYATITNAVREYDADDPAGNGYTVTLSLRNWDTATTKGRAVVALKTKKGKLLTSTESSAFSIRKGATKSIEVFVPYEDAATIAEAYVVGQYKDAVPITGTASSNATYEIDQTNTMTNWSTEDPGDDVTNKQTRTEYRYQTKSTTTSYATSMSGYTQDGGSWVRSGSGSIDYVSSWPSGFNRSSSQYSQYNKAPKTASETTTNKTAVSTSTVGYLYWHWCRGYNGGPINRLISDCYETSYPYWHCFTSSTALGYDGNAGAFYNPRAGTCKDSYWWLATYCWNGTQLPIKRCSYTTYKKLFNYYKWSDWSEWSPTAVTASDSKKVETRTVYRYQPDGLMNEDDNGETRTVTGSVGADFAGKEATLFVYKVDEASDYTNEYVGQTVLDESGNYKFEFKLREEPSVKTGDLTMVLGIEGSSTAIYLDTIEAPKRTYSVKFYNYSGEVLSEQTVAEGSDAELPNPELLAREGYTFTNWSDTNTNIRSDKEIRPEYKINAYNVVFVDWQANSVSVQQFEYGSQLITPQAEEPEEGMTVEWVTSQAGETDGESTGDQQVVVDDKTTVVSDMVVTTRYTKKTCDVTVMDANDNVLTSGAVEYGKAVSLPDMQDENGRTFLGWVNVAEDSDQLIDSTIITGAAILCPKYEYASTVATPYANIASGEYDEAQTVALACDTEGASIFYTTDGSAPNAFNGELYTDPLVIDQPTVLRFYASKAGMGDSLTTSTSYVVNAENARSKWMLAEDLPSDVSNNWSAYSVQQETGYRYKEVKTTTKLAEANALEASGWALVDASSYTDYTGWSDSLATDLGDYIEAETDTQPVYDESSVYEYSHFKYEDANGNAICTSAEVAGYDCTLEKIQFSSRLSVAGFEDGKSYFVYDGEKWFNQNKVTAQVEVGSKYRYRYKIATYAKWTPYTTTAPTSGETREYETNDVFSYARNTCYLVTIIDNGDGPIYQIVDEGGSVDTSAVTPQKGNYVIGYYLDKDFAEEWDVETSKVTRSITLYVKRALEKYNVSFAYEDGTEISSETVDYENAATAPVVDEIPGYKFVGWSSDDYLSVIKDTTVYAKYVAEDDYATVELDNNEVSLYAGKSIGLTAIIAPASHDQDDVTWSSSDEEIAVVSDSGVVTGVGSGTATITAKVGETGETATCNVTVRVNSETNLVVVKNDRISVDNYGYLRGVRAGSDTVKDILSYFESGNARIVDGDGNVVGEDSGVGTGYTVQLVKNGEVRDEMTIVVVGEFNGDGVVSNKDVSQLLRYLVNKAQPTDCQILAADVNGDGYVNNRDAVLISRSLVGKTVL